MICDLCETKQASQKYELLDQTNIFICVDCATIIPNVDLTNIENARHELGLIQEAIQKARTEKINNQGFVKKKKPRM